ncbi:MAG: hypothetical protein AB1489_13355 [Acidobacteriota bacterium]
MLPKDLTPAIIEKLKQTARTNPAGSIPANFDPNNFVFRSNTGFTIMVTFDSYEGEPCWHLSMSYPRRPPRDDEASAALSAFFGEASKEARKVIKAKGANPNVLHYRIAVS